MAVGAVLGLLGLLMLASTANSQTLSFAEADYSEFENNSATRMLQIDKRGTNVGVITVTIMFLSLDQFESEGGDPSGLDIGDAVPAQSDADYDPTTLMMTFPPTTGLDNITFVAPVVSENIHEVDEFFFVQARFGYDNSQDLNDFNSGEDTALFFILNDDEIEFGFDPTSYELSEDGGSIGVVFGKLGGIQTEVPISVMLDFDILNPDEITLDDDFTLDRDLPTTFEFLPSEESLSLTVTAIDDNLLEVDESFALTIFKSTTITLVSISPTQGIADIFILDNEDIVFGFTETEFTVPESIGTAMINLAVFSPDGSQVTLGFVNAMPGFLTDADTVQGTAIDGDDYTGISRQVSLGFDAVTAMFQISPATLMVDIVDDDIREDDEELTLILIPGIAFFPRDIVIRSPNVTRLIIANDDATPSTIGFVQDFYNVSEGVGVVELCVAILEPANLGLLMPGYVANLRVFLESVTAQEGEDFEDLAEDFSLTPTDPEQCFNVAIIDDDILEILEYFRASLESVGSLPERASLTVTEARIDIIDNEVNGTVGIDVVDIIVTEGIDGFAVVVVSFLQPTLISADTFAELSVVTQGDTAEEGSDYLEVTMTVTLSGGGSESMDISITIQDDSVVEPDETFDLLFTVQSDSGNIPFFEPLRATITVIDNDEAVVGLEQNLYETSEDDVILEICAAVMDPVTLTPLSAAELNPVFVAEFDFFLEPVSAIEDEDYSNNVASFSLTQSVPRECFDIAIADDPVFEITEYFNASLNLIGVLPARTSVGITSARVRLLDNDVGVIGLRNESFVVTEADGSIMVYVEFLEPDEISADIVVNATLSTMDDSAFDGLDYNGFMEEITLQGGSMEMFVIDLSIIEDDVVERPESENFRIVLTSSSPLIDEMRLTILPNTAVVTIVDNDDFVESVAGFVEPEYDTTEGSGSVEVCVAILEPADPLSLQDDYVVNFSLSLADNTASAGEDYEDFSMFVSLTTTNPMQCFDIDIIDDDILEPDESFFGNLVLQDPPPPAFTPGNLQTQVTIADNEIGTFGFVVDNVVVLEADGVAVLDGAFLSPAQISPNFSVVFSLSTDDNTAFAGSDYVAEQTLGIVLSGSESFKFNVTIIDDSIQEIPNMENFTVSITLLDSTRPVITLDPSVAYVTIVDDDAPVRIGFDPADYAVNERDGTVEICVSVLEPNDTSQLDPSFQVSLLFSLESGSALVGDDFEDVGASLFFSPATTRQCVVVTIVNDVIVELVEIFSARLSPDGFIPVGVGIMPDLADISITDNEVPSMVGFVESSVVVGEEAEFVELCVAILVPDDPSVLDSTYMATITITTLNGSATAPLDFSSVTVSEILTPFEPVFCFNVTVVDDGILEIDEDFSAILSGELPPAASFGDTTANVQIDDNELGRIGIVNETVSVPEDVGVVTIYVGFIEPDEISEDIIANILFFTEDISATAGEDYNETQAMFALQGGIMELYPVDIPILTDFALEAPENFRTDIEAASPLPPRISLDPGNGRVIITDVPFNPNMTVDVPITTSSMAPVTPGIGATPSPTIRMGGDPHYSIMLPSGQLLCYSVHGEKNFPFNLISNDLLQMNAFFIEDALREEITWIGSLGVVVKHTHYKKSNMTKIRFEASEQMIYINNGVSLHAKRVEKLTLANGKLTVSEALRKRGDKKPEVEVEIVDAGLAFTVRFVKKRHLDMGWRKVDLQPANSHGLIGQFLRKGVEIDKTRKLLYLPAMEPVPVMRSSVWHFMEREDADSDQQFCWQAMNPGYQGKRLIEGNYLDYLVDDVLTSDFKFNPTLNEL